ncbi:MAG: hypothetical protein KatS3mg096_897 [Candidatus Parcubacteria bacterium]|nr:MAG: hypothetical protein KatS3mg096_897 [Candidatus Parcubacteria bacterium]
MTLKQQPISSINWSIVGILIFIPSLIINTLPIVMLRAQLLLATILVLTISEITKLEPYLEIKEIILEKFLRG